MPLYIASCNKINVIETRVIYILFDLAVKNIIFFHFFSSSNTDCFNDSFDKMQIFYLFFLLS